MRAVLKYLFGAEATLKRETVIIVWFLMIFIVVRLFAFVEPGEVDNYDSVTSTVLWAFILLLAAIFGIQVVPAAFGGPSRQSTTVTTDAATIETVTEKPTADRPYEPPANGA